MLAVRVLLRLKDGRKASESRIVNQRPERFDADLPIADMLMAVPVRGERHLRIIEMDHAEFVDTDHPIEGTHGVLIGLWRPDVISGGEDVARVEANPYPLLRLDQVDDR